MLTSVMDQYAAMLDNLEKQNKENMDRLRASLGAVIPETEEDKLSVILDKVTAMELKINTMYLASKMS